VQTILGHVEHTSSYTALALMKARGAASLFFLENLPFCLDGPAQQATTAYFFVGAAICRLCRFAG
jgi:hypothetical protein